MILKDKSKKEREQIKLKMFFDKDRWERLLNTANKKGLNSDLIRYFMTPEGRIDLYNKIVNKQYKIFPPHKAKIPKDTGGFRIVYVNEDVDRIYLSIYNDMMFELHSDMIHESCKSYQKGISCGNTVKSVSKQLIYYNGYKSDMTHYFDSTPLREIIKIFDLLQMDTCVDIPVVEYYKSNLVFDEDNKLIEEYAGMKQGCAFSTFLANVLLYDVDKEISEMKDVLYVRYSDDILIIGKNADVAMEVLRQRLSEKGLSLNPKKTEKISNEKWFEFLGFKIKGKEISFSDKSVNNIKTIIRNCTVDYKREIKGNIIYDISPQKAINKLNRIFYKNYTVYNNHDFGLAEYFLPVVNVKKDIETINIYAIDAIRSTFTGKKKIGNICSVNDRDDYTIVRTKGRNVKANRNKTEPKIKGYVSLVDMWNTINTDKQAFKLKARLL